MTLSPKPTNESSKQQQAAPSPLPHRPHYTKPSCTHIHMDKLYGGRHVCTICGRVPSLGWVYACQQDASTPTHQEQSKIRKRAVKNRKSIGMELEILGFNKSVIFAAEAGEYTREQIETLKQQKIRAKEVIESALDEHELLQSKHGPSATLLSEKLAALDKTEVKSTQNKRARVYSKSVESCDFKCCHTCRPFARDRSFISVESAIDGDLEVPTSWDENFMPVHHAALVGSIGLSRQETFNSEAEETPNLTSASSSPSFSDVHDTLGHGYGSQPTSPLGLRQEQALENLKSGQQRTRHHHLRHEPTQQDLKSVAEQERLPGRSFRDSLQKSLHEMIKRREESPSGRSMASLDEKITRLKSIAEEEQDGFNLELWKQLVERELERAAATKLPDDSGTDWNEPAPTTKGQTAEQHVEGGVALTEEAVETKSPDIIMSI